MRKVIYADDISRRLEKVIQFGAKADDGEHPISAECVLSVLESLPTVDAVPVVRCKDCIRFRPDDDVWGWCTVSGKMRCKDYCSYGVREDGDHAEGTIQEEQS